MGRRGQRREQSRQVMAISKPKGREGSGGMTPAARRGLIIVAVVTVVAAIIEYITRFFENLITYLESQTAFDAGELVAIPLVL